MVSSFRVHPEGTAVRMIAETDTLQMDAYKSPGAKDGGV
jgi:hypothetical protein